MQDKWLKRDILTSEFTKCRRVKYQRETVHFRFCFHNFVQNVCRLFIYQSLKLDFCLVVTLL